MAHIHEKYVYDPNGAFLYETENFGIRHAKVYDPLTRKMRRGYVLVNKDDGIVQGDSWSLMHVINAMAQSQQGVALAAAWAEQQGDAQATDALVTQAFGDDDTVH